MAFKDYYKVPANNTLIGDDIYVGPNMARDNVRPALQQLMADGKSLADTLSLAVFGGHLDFYADTASGLAATESGEFFAVFEDDVAVIYMNNAGVAEEVGRIGTATNAAFVLPEGDGETDQSAEIQAIIDTASALAVGRGTMVTVDGNGLHAIATASPDDVGITVKTGVHLNMKGGGLKALTAMETLIEVESGARFTDSLVDANSLAQHAVKTYGASHYKLLDLEVINWINGVRIDNPPRSENDVEGGDCEIGWIWLHSPAASPIYPFRVSARDSKHIHRANIHHVTIDGPYKNYGSGGTADQFACQGLSDSDIDMIVSRGGGEIGIDIIRNSKDVRCSRLVAYGNDGHGIQAGSAFAALTLDDVTGLAVGDNLKGVTSGNMLRIDVIWGNIVYGSTVGPLIEGESVKQAIQLNLANKPSAYAVGETVTGLTSGAKGVIQRILGLSSPTQFPRIFVEWNGVDHVGFINGEDITNGTTVNTIQDINENQPGVNHDPPLTTTSTPTITAIELSRNISFDNCTAFDNGLDFDKSWFAFTETPANWSYGDTVTGSLSGATGTFYEAGGPNSIVARIVVTSGTFVVGDVVTNGTDSYTIAYVDGYFSGLVTQQADHVSFTNCRAYDTRPTAQKTQKFGLEISQSTNVLDDASNKLDGNLIRERQQNGVSTYVANTYTNPLIVEAAFSLPRGGDLTPVEGPPGRWTITPNKGYHHVAGPSIVTDIAPGEDGQRLALSRSTLGGDAIITNSFPGAGNISSPTGAIVLASNRDIVVLQYRKAPACWVVEASNVRSRARKRLRLPADFNLVDTTAVQRLFNNTAAGALTLDTLGVYSFRAQLTLASMSATSGNCDLNLLGAGTATLANQWMRTIGRDGLTFPQNLSGNFRQGANNFGGDVVAAAISSDLNVVWEGEFEVTAGGTIIPSLALTTAAPAVAKQNNSFEVWWLSAPGENTLGEWS